MVLYSRVVLPAMRTVAPSPAAATLILVMVLGPVFLAGAFATGAGEGVVVSLRLGGGVVFAASAGEVLTERSGFWLAAGNASVLLGAVGEYGCEAAGVADMLLEGAVGLGRAADFPRAEDPDCPEGIWAGVLGEFCAIAELYELVELLELPELGGLSAVELGRLVCGKGFCTPTSGGVLLLVAN